MMILVTAVTFRNGGTARAVVRTATLVAGHSVAMVRPVDGEHAKAYVELTNGTGFEVAETSVQIWNALNTNPQWVGPTVAADCATKFPRPVP